MQVLALTARLRYHDLPYIRALAAQALGLLFRRAAAPALKAGVRAVAAEAAARPATRTEAAGQVDGHHGLAYRTSCTTLSLDN